MQILIYVTTMLMLLSILTYARVDAYRSFSAIRAQFEQYSTKGERALQNKRAVKWYESTVVSKKPVNAKDKEKQDKEKKIQAFSKLSLYPLVDKKARELPTEEQTRAPKVQQILKNLMNLLYDKADFYGKVLETNPELPDILIDSIIAAADKLPKKQAITTTHDFANLNLGTSQLNEIFYKMLKGTQNDIKSKDNNAYESILPYISLTKKANVSIYLASRKLLLALTGDENLVNRILQRRRALYAEVTSDGAPDNVKELASEHFKREFEGNFGSMADDFLDFSVTKTDPSKYEENK
jgi:hypothetical protein